MYLAVVILTMLVLPAGSVAVEAWGIGSTAPLILLVGKWFVFWGVGVRLTMAGVRQYFQPRFTAEAIFGITDDVALPLVRELGIANVATGVVGLASLAQPSFTLPVAISAAIFYGIAGVRHIAETHKSRNETLAMVSDLFIFIVLASYAGWALTHSG